MELTPGPLDRIDEAAFMAALPQYQPGALSGLAADTAQRLGDHGTTLDTASTELATASDTTIDTDQADELAGVSAETGAESDYAGSQPNPDVPGAVSSLNGLVDGMVKSAAAELAPVISPGDTPTLQNPPPDEGSDTNPIGGS